MLIEIALAIILSICMTALIYGISLVFTKKWKINHPKNRLFILLIVLFTAFSILPFATISLSTIDDHFPTNNAIPDIKGTPISSSTILTKNQNITYASSITPLQQSETNKADGITRYIQRITWNELIIYDEYQPFEPTDDSSHTQPVNTSQFLKKTLIAINQDDIKTPELINQIMTNILIDQNHKQKETIPTNEQTSEDETDSTPMMIPPQTIFVLGMGILCFLSLSYLLLSISIGTSHTLKQLKATPCKDDKIIDLIHTLSHEFTINPPKIYQFDGPPNAFVFGHPAILVFSTQLKHFLTEKEFEAALRHELAHIKHHDTLLKPALQALRIFFFYNPLVYILTNKITKNMELLADTQTFSSKKEKISLMEALIKISDHSQMSQTRPIPSYQIPLISYHSKKLSLTERFTNLFESTSKKTIISLLLGAIILFANISLFFVAGAIVETQQTQSPTTGEHQEFSIDESYYSQSIKYTKVERNAKTYLAMIVQKNLYNVISTKTPRSEIIDDMMHQLFPHDPYVGIPQPCHDSY